MLDTNTAHSHQASTPLPSALQPRPLPLVPTASAMPACSPSNSSAQAIAPHSQSCSK
jgi:hypothetical protein